jgi:hypothetical protein
MFTSKWRGIPHKTDHFRPILRVDLIYLISSTQLKDPAFGGGYTISNFFFLFNYIFEIWGLLTQKEIW